MYRIRGELSTGRPEEVRKPFLRHFGSQDLKPVVFLVSTVGLRREGSMIFTFHGVFRVRLYKEGYFGIWSRLENAGECLPYGSG